MYAYTLPSYDIDDDCIPDFFFQFFFNNNGNSFGSSINFSEYCIRFIEKSSFVPFPLFSLLKKPLTKNTLWQENLVPRFISYVRMKGRSNTGNIKINLSHLQGSCLKYHNCVYFLCILSKFLNNFIYLCYNGSMINRVHVLFHSFHSNFQSG